MSVLNENFELVYGTTVNIQSLRNKVLDLAIQGKLVEQKSDDEPAEILYEHLCSDRNKQVLSGNLGRFTKKEEVKTSEQPFKLPKNWIFKKINDIAFVTKLAGFEYTKYVSCNLVKSGIPLFKGKNIQNGKLDLNFESFIPKEISDILVRSKVNKKCLLTPYVGTIGNIALFDGEGEYHLGSNVGKIEFISGEQNYILEEFGLLFFGSIIGKAQLTKFRKATAQESISIDAIRECIFPIPPYEEQKRIVAKVETLMAEIDKLEEALKQKEHLLELLPKAVVDAIGNCQNGDELKEQLRLIIDNFDVIFQTPDSMQELRNVILQLAIEGKLVEQNPDDEPAENLLTKIYIERDKLVREGKLKRQKDLAPITDDEIPFAIPSNWKWVRLGEITTYGNNKNVNPEEIKDSEWVLELEDIEKNSSRITSIITNNLRKSKSNKSRFVKGDVLYGKLRPYLKKMLVAPDDGVCTTEIIAFRGVFGVSSDYILNYLKSRYVDEYVNSITHGMNMPRLGTDNGRELLFPLPPTEEQIRIVAKVDSLMSLIDQLESELTKKNEVIANFALV